MGQNVTVGACITPSKGFARFVASNRGGALIGAFILEKL